MNRFLYLFVLLTVLSPVQLAAAASYMVTQLGPVGSSSDLNLMPTGLNDSGQVVGNYETAARYSGAFLYSNGVMRDLGFVAAYGISDNGLVTGSTIAGIYGNAPLLYRNGVFQVLADVGTGTGYAVNNSGEVVGESDQAFLYSNGTVQRLGTLGGLGSIAYGINNNGQIVGLANTPNFGPAHAFLYSNGEMQDLGTLGGSTSLACAINNSGEVVGYSYATNGHNYAFLYSHGVMQNLGALDDTASFCVNNSANTIGINNRGQIVGAMELEKYNDAYRTEAFLYSGGTLYDLNSLIDPSLGITLSTAVGINDAGQIVAYAGAETPTYGSAYLLTPVPELRTGESLVAGGLLVAAIVGFRPRISRRF